MTTKLKNMTEECEAILIDDRNYKINHSIWPADIANISYLLTQGLSMEKAYNELSVLTHQQRAQILDILVGTMSSHSPQDAIEMRSSRKKLVDVNKEICKLAIELANLIEERETLNDTLPFSSNTHYSVTKVIKNASNKNQLFQFHLAKPFGQLTSQFDLKYWPSLSSFVKEIADDASVAEIEAKDPATEAATSSNRSSKADFAKALLANLDQLKTLSNWYSAQNFKFSDSALADIVNVSLKLNPDRVADSVYIKNLRAREKRSAKMNE